MIMFRNLNANAYDSNVRRGSGNNGDSFAVGNCPTIGGEVTVTGEEGNEV